MNLKVCSWLNCEGVQLLFMKNEFVLIYVIFIFSFALCILVLHYFCMLVICLSSCYDRKFVFFNAPLVFKYYTFLCYFFFNIVSSCQ